MTPAWLTWGSPAPPLRPPLQLVKDLLSEGKLRALVPADGRRASPAPAASPEKRKRRAEAPRRRDRRRDRGGVKPAQPGSSAGGAEWSGELLRRTPRGQPAAPGGEAKPEEQRAAPPEAAAAAAAPKKAAPAAYGAEIVAARVKVYWPLEKSW